MSLPTMEEALASMLAAVRPLAVAPVPVGAADGRWLAETVAALRDQPPFDASAMDGWAVRSADAAKGARLRIVGESLAGHAPDAAFTPGDAMRIFTGAALPSGADRVVIQEEARRDGDQLVVEAEADSAAYVRPRGCDFMAGETLLEAGQRLNPWRIALAASAGIATLPCHAAPRVALLSTGDELVAPGGLAGPHQIYDSCTPALAAFVAHHGGRPMPPAQVPDDEAAIAAAVAGAACDIIVTIGGASVGDRDLVKPAVRGLGARLLVEGVQMRPGKPVWFAILGDGRPLLGLPGNPASALVCAELFLAPLLARLQGGDTGERFATARLAGPIAANGPRDHYLRGRLGRDGTGGRVVTAFANQDSSLVSVMAAADVLVRRRPNAPAAEAGEPVEVLEPGLVRDASC
ncbi:molybdopterin molybdotransferase MoeA [Sphingomonas quercus]|uniref:Molybdopterin molybdenumtransferase n=1 Tax=Sphingomonas quercus TaxID=2842451 RepID=A0ABS6BLN8_9SPHN|nr:gephyrin-like molybdotransferase Glp [Sphingomonas quercus]MBU3079232.1 molybdopterin molybdotransferase MoeA [Sphingomonas quercus]